MNNYEPDYVSSNNSRQKNRDGQDQNLHSNKSNISETEKTAKESNRNNKSVKNHHQTTSEFEGVDNNNDVIVEILNEYNRNNNDDDKAIFDQYEYNLKRMIEEVDSYFESNII